MLAVLGRSTSVREDLSSWSRSERHEYLGYETMAAGIDRHLIARGDFYVPLQTAKESRLTASDGKLTASDVLQVSPLPPIADPFTGFAPRGTRVEPGGPTYPFTLNERDHVAPPEVAPLYDKAVSAQWDASRDIPWNRVKPLPFPLAVALAQVMTFLAENELSALYVPSRFIPRIHPAYAEVAMFLASQLADEARHIDVLLKRGRLGGGGPGRANGSRGRRHGPQGGCAWAPGVSRVTGDHAPESHQEA